MESKARKTKERIGWHWGEVGRDKGEKEGEREKQHMRQAHTRMEGVN